MHNRLRQKQRKKFFGLVVDRIWYKMQRRVKDMDNKNNGQYLESDSSSSSPKVKANNREMSPDKKERPKFNQKPVIIRQTQTSQQKPCGECANYNDHHEPTSAQCKLALVRHEAIMYRRKLIASMLFRRVVITPNDEIDGQLRRIVSNHRARPLSINAIVRSYFNENRMRPQNNSHLFEIYCRVVLVIVNEARKAPLQLQRINIADKLEPNRHEDWDLAHFAIAKVVYSLYGDDKICLENFYNYFVDTCLEVKERRSGIFISRKIKRILDMNRGNYPDRQ